jgi:hypothetical protein
MNSMAKTLDGPPRSAAIDISDLRVAAVLIFVILNIAVFLVRLVIILRYGALFPTSGGEPIIVYSIWKAVHHLAIYEWPLAYPFSVSPYNYLFYETYSSFLRMVGATGDGIMTWGRLLTIVFALVGAIAQWKFMQAHLSLRGARSILSLLFAAGLWLSASIIRYWAITIRPDIPAIAIVMIALWMVVRRPRFGFVYAGVFFYLAWSFKQSIVLSLVGVCLFLMFHKRWRDLSVLAAVFAVLAAATLLLGSPEYRFNIFAATRLIPWSLMWAFQIAPKSLIANVYWILAPIALLFAANSRRVDNTVRMLTAILMVALAGGLVGMAKMGSWDNYLLEAFVAGSTLLQIAVFTAPGRLVSVLLLFGCVQPAIQLAAPQSGTHAHTFGTVGIATAAEYADAVALRGRLASLKKPIFTSNEIFSLPWFSNDNRAPALVIDPMSHQAMLASCQNGCVEGMLQRGEIPTVMLRSSGDIYQNSLSPKYVKISEAGDGDRLWSIYTLNHEAPVRIAK